MLTLLQNVCALVGRVLLIVIFLSSGVNYIFDWNKFVTMLRDQLTVLPGTPLAEHREALAPILLIGAAVFLLAGGLSILLGFFTRIGALLLVAFLVPTTVIFHNFWAYESDGMEHVVEMSNFLKNIGMLGGLLVVMAFGPGWFAADTFVRRKRK